jgi:hypothetical protein
MENRTFPDHKSVPHIKERRFTVEDFKKVKSFKYKQWKSGINPLSKRKVTIKGRVHSDYGCDTGFSDLSPLEKFDEESFAMYNEETIRILEPIDKAKKDIDLYNKRVDEAISKIKNLSWKETYEFDGILYSIPGIVDSIHRENDCMGEMIVINREYCNSCNRCDSWAGFENGSCGRVTITRQCSKCRLKV